MCFACICINQVCSIVDVNTTLLSKDNYELTRQNDQQTFFPVKILLESTIIYLRRENISIFLRVSTQTRCLCICFASVESDQPIVNSATFPSQKSDVKLLQFKWPIKQISKRKSTFQNTIYVPVASSLVS